VVENHLTILKEESINFYLAIRSIVVKLTKGEAPDTAQINKKVADMIEETIKSIRIL